MTRIWVERPFLPPAGRGPSPQERFVPGFVHGFVDLTDRPMATLKASRQCYVIFEEGGMAAPSCEAPAKPPYRVPSMTEIRALPWNGFTAVSTFSGCGGSSLGYRMAGFRVAWASEFVPAAADTYRANAAAETVLDTRDIRRVQPADLLRAAGVGVGEIDLFDGSPPCASFSTAGKRERGWGQVKTYSDTAQRSDDLFYEYARLIEGTRPRVFVAENVSGLVKGTAKGYFKLILARLRGCGYRVEARLLDASWLGVPQARQRLFFVGVRDDLDMAPAFPKPFPYQYSVRDALPDVLAQGDNGGFGKGRLRPADQPSPTLGASPQTGNGTAPPSVIATRRAEVRELLGAITHKGVASPDEPSPTVLTHGNAYTHSELGLMETGEGSEPLITHDPETGQDLRMTRYALGKLWHETKPGSNHPRRFNLARPDPDRPLPTIVQRGSDPSTAGVTHWSQCRKLTLGELRRLGGFPDDFTLTGTYAQRWERIGRAVPPVMMSHIAAAVRDQILVPLREAGTI